MSEGIKKTWSSFAVVAVVTIAVGCSARRDTEVTSVRQSLTTKNGLTQNGLTTNGLIENGFWTNGFWTNGFWTNGFWTNGFWTNGFWTNGFWTNGFWTNGISGNGFWTNGFWTNGFWTNGLDGTPNAAGEILRSNVYARELLQYIYSCAMPADGYDTSLDPNQAAPIPCTPPGAVVDGGTDAGSDGGTGCDAGYACSSEGKCVIPLQGGGANGSGLAVNADGTTWWGSGKCDESCQRWISACVLARTNAYGVHVEISMRAPADAPQAIKDALQVADSERSSCPVGSETDPNCGYTLREGAYYGNIFATTPVNPVPSPTVGPDGGVVPYSGPTTGPIASTPSYNACAGPGSNIPEITKRFCSSQGDQVVINVPGVCLTATTQSGATEAGTCVGEDTNSISPTFGAIQDCYTSAAPQPRASCSNYRDPACYNEVITVYLKQPIAVCGNAVCEDDGTPTSPETATSCPSDCHPNTWAQDLAPTIVPTSAVELQAFATGAAERFSSQHALSVVAPDDSIFVAGTSSVDVDLGGGIVSASNGIGRLAKYDSGGRYLWGISFGNTSQTAPSGQLYEVNGIAIAPNGNVIVVGSTRVSTTTALQEAIWLGTYTADGVEVSVTSVPVGTTTTLRTFQLSRAAGVDSQGNMIVAGAYRGTIDFGSAMSFTSTDYSVNDLSSQASLKTDIFLVKLAPQGDPLWAQTMGGAGDDPKFPPGTFLGEDWPLSLAVGPSDEIVLVTTCDDAFASGQNNVLKFSPSGIQLWTHGSAVSNFILYSSAAVDQDGNVYATGWDDGYSFAAGHDDTLVTGDGGGPFLVKYDPDGTFQWASYGKSICPPTGQCAFSSVAQGVQGVSISFDSDNVVLGSAGHPSTGGGIDFGVGVFPTYAAPNIFMSAYKSEDGRLVWAKQIPTIVASALIGTTVDSNGHVVLSGIYSGSMQSDDRLLVTRVPEQTGTIDSFLSSFAAPSPIDTTSPCIGNIGTCSAPATTVPQDIVAQATSSAGAVVFFMPPTAIDTDDAGTAVVCSPRPNTTFPIGATLVTCIASDPIGNASKATFTVTVVDMIAPLISPVADIQVQATSGSGAIVSFQAPSAVDQVDGAVVATCLPQAGSLLPVGTSRVTCTASDRSNNESQTIFSVTVTPAPLGVPCTSPAQCAAGVCVDGVCCNTRGSSCGQCQACNVQGSVGTCTPISGGSCSDGNGCTQNDTCQNGVCQDGAAITCTAQDQCHAAGVCDPSTGTCSSPPAANGTPCNDGNACTQADTCQAGACTGGSPVTCAAPDQCHVAGSCNPLTGLCSSAAAPNGTACNDGNTCTTGDVCSAGACVGGAPKSCDDGNPCTTDSCNPTSGCVNTSSASGPPKLNPGTNQTIVGACSSTPVPFALPTLASSSCSGTGTISCTAVLGSGHFSCGTKAARNGTLPGNGYGAYTVTCTAKDTSGKVSPPVSFTVTVLQPLTVRVQPPLSGDNDSVDNVVKAGSTVPTKVQLFACGANVTTKASVTVKLAVTSMPSGGASTKTTVTTTTSAADTSGVMTLDGSNYRYNLSTKGFVLTASVPAFFQENVTVAYKSAPSVVVGSDAIELDTK